MAPEQVEGKEADAQTDLFAFGAVVYEMTTGQKAFTGKSQASVIGAIMSLDPPPMVSLQPLTPPLLDHIVKRCLAKDPDERWQAAGDVMRELKWIADEAGAQGTVTIGPRARRRERIAWVIAGLAVLAVAALGVATVLYVGRAAPESLPTRFEIQTPPTSDPTSFALSPDGRQLAFVATAEGAPRLWVRPLDRVTAQTLAGTEGASYPFWAPDGRAIGFFAGGKLKRIDRAGGTPQVLADAPAERGGTWNRDGVIVFAPAGFAPLMRIAATGGTPVAVTRLAAGSADRSGGGQADAGDWPTGAALRDTARQRLRYYWLHQVEAAVCGRPRRALSDERNRRGSDRFADHRRPQLDGGAEEIDRDRGQYDFDRGDPPRTL